MTFQRRTRFYRFSKSRLKACVKLTLLTQDVQMTSFQRYLNVRDVRWTLKQTLCAYWAILYYITQIARSFKGFELWIRPCNGTIFNHQSRVLEKSNRYTNTALKRQGRRRENYDKAIRAAVPFDESIYYNWYSIQKSRIDEGFVRGELLQN